ncbi:hypothetical protein AB0A63_13890 [Lentzea sp. NPDC042327]|uniref:hypothetical protein n=1 Tax=Lentzea sp. NPDC042327 TaxID=3154801 RepID=UPI0033CE91FF
MSNSRSSITGTAAKVARPEEPHGYVPSLTGVRPLNSANPILYPVGGDHVVELLHERGHGRIRVRVLDAAEHEDWDHYAPGTVYTGWRSQFDESPVTYSVHNSTTEPVRGNQWQHREHTAPNTRDTFAQCWAGEDDRPQIPVPDCSACKRERYCDDPKAAANDDGLCWECRYELNPYRCAQCQGPITDPDAQYIRGVCEQCDAKAQAETRRREAARLTGRSCPRRLPGERFPRCSACT